MSSSSEDFSSGIEIYEAIGAILHEVSSQKSKNDIIELCDRFHEIIKPQNDKINEKNRRILDAPVLLGQMAANADADLENMTSIWVQQKKDALASRYLSVFNVRF